MVTGIADPSACNRIPRIADYQACKSLKMTL